MNNIIKGYFNNYDTLNIQKSVGYSVLTNSETLSIIVNDIKTS